MADAADVIAGRPAPPGDKDHEENSTLGRKILSKLAPHKHKEANFDPIPENPKINTNHPKIEGYVEAGVHAGLHQTLANLSKPETMALIAQLVRAQAAVGTAAAIEEALDVVGSEKGLKLVGNLVAAQAIILTKQAMEPLGRTAARTSAMEAVTGSYDAVARKVAESFHYSQFTKVVVFPLGGLYCLMLLGGMLLALWRFALFGLN